MTTPQPTETNEEIDHTPLAYQDGYMDGRENAIGIILDALEDGRTYRQWVEAQEPNFMYATPTQRRGILQYVRAILDLE